MTGGATVAAIVASLQVACTGASTPPAPKPEDAAQQFVGLLSPPRDRPKVEDCKPRQDATKGYLTIHVIPWAKVYLGPVLLGATPISKLEVPAGCLDLKVVVEGEERWLRTLVEPGRVRRIQVKFAQLDVSRKPVEPPKADSPLKDL